MKMIKQILCILIFISVWLVSCNENSTTTVQSTTGSKITYQDEQQEIIQYESCELIYELNRLGSYKDGSNVVPSYYNGYIEINHGVYGSVITSATKIYREIYDLDGNHMEQQTTATIHPWIIENGKELFVSRNVDQGQIHIYLTDEDGAVIRESKPFSSNTGSYMFSSDSGYLFCHVPDEHLVYVFDTDLNLYDTLSYPGSLDIVQDYQDSILMINTNGATSLYDPETKHCESVILYKETPLSRRASTYYYTDDSVYYTLPDGIYVQRDGEDSLLCDFSRSYFAEDELKIHAILPGERFLVMFTDAFTGEFYPAILAPTEETERPVRKVLRVAAIGNNLSIGHDGDHTNAVNSVAYFNRNNEEYVMELIDYDVLAQYNEDGTPYQPASEWEEHAVELFEHDLLEGEPYDVYLFGTRFAGFDALASKGIFADLSGIAKRVKLLACVEDALTQNDTITAIPFSVSLSTLITTTEVLAQDEVFTYDTLFSIRDSLAEGEALFGQYTQRELTDIALTDFVDFENKTCTYDSPDFARVLTFLSEFEASVFGGGGGLLNRIVTPTFNNTYGVLNTGTCINMYGDLLTPFVNGTVKFLQFDIGSPKAIPLIYYLEEMTGKELNICGYPTKDGGSIHMALGMRMAIFEGGAHTDGAKRYVSMMLSDAVQTKAAQASFPVVRSAVENAIDWGTQYYLTRSGVDNSGVYEWGTDFFADFMGSTQLSTPPDVPYNKEISVLKPKYDAMLSYVCDSKMRTVGDETIRQIIDEELSAAVGGARSVADAAKIIQSRVFIYINE